MQVVWTVAAPKGSGCTQSCSRCWKWATTGLEEYRSQLNEARASIQEDAYSNYYADYSEVVEKNW